MVGAAITTSSGSPSLPLTKKIFSPVTLITRAVPIETLRPSQLLRRRYESVIEQ